MFHEIINLNDIIFSNMLERNEDYMKSERVVRGINKYKWSARHKVNRSEYIVSRKLLRYIFS